jgi:glycosyltransferase involved in cell wall biosynthesis
MMSPLISILIPVYNREKFIAECIESALAQTYTNIEVVIVDNASTDGTWGICRQFAEKDQRVRIYQNDTNVGPVRNWLACVAQARGVYTKILWSDDLIHIDFLETLLPYLYDKSVGFVYSSVDVFEVNKDIITHKYFINLDTGIYDSKEYINGVLLGGGFPYSPGCAVFRTSDVRKNLLLQIPNRINSDFSMHAIGNDVLLFLLTAYQYQKFAVVKQPLSFFRAHSESITTAAKKGCIPLHYDLAKGFFTEQFIIDSRILKKLNTKFLIDLFRYKSMANKLGIKKLNDFYPSNNQVDLDLYYLLNRIKCYIKDIFNK